LNGRFRKPGSVPETDNGPGGEQVVADPGFTPAGNLYLNAGQRSKHRLNCTKDISRDLVAPGVLRPGWPAPVCTGVRVWKHRSPLLKLHRAVLASRPPIVQGIITACLAHADAHAHAYVHAHPTSNFYRPLLLARPSSDSNPIPILVLVTTTFAQPLGKNFSLCLISTTSGLLRLRKFATLFNHLVQCCRSSY